MKQFLLIYNSTQEDQENFKNLSQKIKDEEMAKWMAWQEKNNHHIVDFGAPVFNPIVSQNANNWQNIQSAASGYSILKANSLDELKESLKDHPHMNESAASSITIHECISM